MLGLFGGGRHEAGGVERFGIFAAEIGLEKRRLTTKNGGIPGVFFQAGQRAPYIFYPGLCMDGRTELSERAENAETGRLTAGRENGDEHGEAMLLVVSIDLNEETWNLSTWRFKMAAGMFILKRNQLPRVQRTHAKCIQF